MGILCKTRVLTVLLVILGDCEHLKQQRKFCYYETSMPWFLYGFTNQNHKRNALWFLLNICIG